MKRLIWLGLAVSGWGATTQTWEMSTFQDFMKGRIQGLALDRDGRLTVGPKLDLVYGTGQPMIWSIASGADGRIYAGTGHRGKVIQVTAAGVGSVLWSADQAEVFAVAVGPDGAVYAGTSPDGKVYRIADGKAAEFFDPKAKYIWALTFGKDGTLYVGCGDPGTVFRVGQDGKGEVYYGTGQGNVTSLALDSEGRVLAGTDPNGIIYRISGRDKAFVLYDSNLPEIRELVATADGCVYAVALGGSVAARTGQLTTLPASAGSAVISGGTTTVTVTDTPSQAGADIKPKPAGSAVSNGLGGAGGVGVSQVVETAGVEKSAIYRINGDLTVETLWSSKDENAYGLAVRAGGEVWFGTDAQGRVYRLVDRRVALVAQGTEGEVTRVVAVGSGLVVATGDLGKLFRLGEVAAGGTYESPVHDSGSVARWGRIRWRGVGVKMRVRSGNSGRPDSTWSDWSEELGDAEGSLMPIPNARFVQWRAVMAGTRAVLESVTVAYLPQNGAPVVRSITVGAGGSKAAGAASGVGAAFTVTVTDSGEGVSPAGTPAQVVGRTGGGQILLSWQADDPDGDKLVYSLYFRGEGEREWKLLRSGVAENTLSIDGEALADGWYWFRVVASDRGANGAGTAREGELVSSPVLIDNTAPVVRIGGVRRVGAGLEFVVEALDGASALRRCEYSVDGGSWVVVEAMDGVTDSRHEEFRVAVRSFPAGERLVVVRVYDVAGNVGLAKRVVRPEQ